MALQVGEFALAGVVSLALVGLGTSIAARRVGEREAITEVRATAATKAEGLVRPVLADALVDGDDAARQAVADVVTVGVLDASLVRVKLWTPEGRIVYSDEPRLVGTRFSLDSGELAALRTGTIEADVSNLSRPENQFERPFGRLLEVYLPVFTPSDRPLLFEAYFRYDAVSSAGSRLWRSFAPIALGALVLLELVQLPLAGSLAGRLRQRLRERERLLLRALDASELERRRIASDLHDGVVQDLVGVAYSLSASARRMDDPASTDLLEVSADHVRSSIGALRSLLVEIYPPNLADEGIHSALSDLVNAARSRGLAVELDLDGLDPAVPPAAAQLLYRAAQEALRNVVRHARARSVRVMAVTVDNIARLQVDDDGQGFDVEGARTRAADGHLGLRGLEGLVADGGGRMELLSSPGAGTSVAVEVPTA
ncbi:MAG: sensor histidine kinase [Acidimicrobiales bacterium]